MKRINVFRAFILNAAHGVEHRFAVGVHEVDEHIAAHWFVQAHSEEIAAPITGEAPIQVNSGPQDGDSVLTQIATEEQALERIASDVASVAEKLVETISPKAGKGKGKK